MNPERVSPLALAILLIVPYFVARSYTSRRIYTYTDKVFRSSGGAPDKLVDLYKAHTSRHRD